MDQTAIKMILGLVARRAATSLAAILVASGAVASDDQTKAITVFAGIIIWAAEFAIEWWRKSGMVMVSAQLARVKGIPLPHDTPAVPVVLPSVTTGRPVEVVSKSA